MFNHISEKVAENMVKNGTVVSEEKEIYLFGIQQGLIFLLNIGTTVAVGLLLGSLWKLLLFTTAYIALRKYAGGYHARTPKQCYVLSTLLSIVVALMVKYVELNIFVGIGLLVFASIIIVMFSPVENRNKLLDEVEKRVYKKWVLVILSIEFLLAIVFMFFNLLPIANCIVWVIVMVSFMVILGMSEGNGGTLT